MNTVVVQNHQQEQEGGMRRDFYIIDMDRERKCYSCGRFGHLVQNCRRWGNVGQVKRIAYKDNQNTRNNLNGKENLIVLD